MRLYKVGVEPGSVVPLHFYEGTLSSDIEEGQLTLKTKKDNSNTFRGRRFFLSVFMWVTVAAAQGVPTLTNVEG